ncbi:bifunctional diguanylate cyclase/phosphodiesterase [Lacisediminimonas profundi]|uniref:bifunctional diguanylate cyclase/phosphodiesterase n=1 Tax=Lacisediminimonas profundi TaxID=2603856 RepID=UPI00124B5605|nr:EAL domain-containing protein [Lacisediminimonas profundi]
MKRDITQDITQDRDPLTLDGRTAGWGVHDSHRSAVREIFGLLALLAAVQYVSWLIPTPDDYKGIDHYLVLHSFMEIVSIVISMMVFAVGWNSRTEKIPGILVVLAGIFFVVGLLDFSHTFAYVGMPDFFGPNDGDKHLGFWMSARFVAALGLLAVAIQSWDRGASLSAKHLFLSVLVLLTLVLGWVIVNHQDWLPRWFIPGLGLTPAKKNVEYVIIMMNLATAVFLWRKLRKPQAVDAVMLWGAVCIMAMSELFFTMYSTMTGLYNVLGHIYKFVAYVLIYRAVVVESIDRPYRELANAQQKLELAVAASDTGLWDWNLSTGECYFSPVWKSQLGYQDAELENRLSTWKSLLHPDDCEAAIQRQKDFFSAPPDSRYESEFRLRHKDGSYRWIYSRGETILDDQGVAVRMVGSHTDITARKREEDRFRSAVQASPNAMIMVDEAGIIVLTNSQADSLFDYEGGGLIGANIEVLIPAVARKDHQRSLVAFVREPSRRAMGRERYLFARRRNGDEFRVEIGLTPITGQAGNYVLASVVDITSRLEAEKRIEKLINYDVLTELPNRQLLKDRVDHAISAAIRSDTRIAVLYLNLDRFKNVNDTLGHKVGDELLMNVAKRLTLAVRQSDTVARVVGDEFVIVLTDANEDVVARAAAKLLESISQTYVIQGQELVVTPSIGIALYPEDGADFDSLLQSADTAMNRVKQDGRNDFRFFAREMQMRTTRMLQLESAMHQALERNQFHVLYQPQVTMDGSKVVGVEALLRWTHPELGNISPAEFIPLAESSGQIVAIGSWVLRTAVMQLKEWMNAGLPPMVMAVNLSAVQFRHVNLPGLVSSILEDAELPPEYLELELTESVAMENAINAITVMDDLHARGVRLAIDDFGTGYSSLSYLKKFNVCKLKIDQSFVRDIATDEDDRAIVMAIIQMAGSLGFKTIAEGVETEAQSAFLRAQGCDEFQGYIFSKPLAADQLEQLLRRAG